MNPPEQFQNFSEQSLAGVTVRSLQEQLKEVNSQLALVKKMEEFGIGEERNDAFFTRATKTLQILREKGVGEEMATSFASVEAALADASKSGASLEEIFATIEPSAVKLVTHLLKPAFKNSEDAKVVFAKTKALMRDDTTKLFVDALLEAVHEYEFTVDDTARNAYADPSGVLVFDKSELREGGLS